jgi:RNA-directed DNA polymerase
MYLSCITTYVEKQKLFDKDKRFLPQGAPTSPYLSNLLLKDFDDKLGLFCSQNKIKYTRYADDLAFSGEKIVKDNLIKFIQNELGILDLHLNKEKITFMKQNSRQLISGVVVNKKMQLPKDKRNKIRQIMYFINKYGLKSHLENINENRENYILHILGVVQYGLNLNSDDKELKKYQDDLLKLYKKNN